MSNLVEARACVLEKVVSSLLDDRTPFDLLPCFLEGRTDFKLRVPAAYMGRILGIGGHHIRCIQLLAEIMGNQIGQQWVVYLEEPWDPDNRYEIPPDPIPDEHDTSDSALLLADILEACVVKAEVTVRGGIAGGYDFGIIPEAHEDYATLCDPHPAMYRRTKRGSPPINLVVAIGILFKAIGLANGVHYRVDTQ